MRLRGVLTGLLLLAALLAGSAEAATPKSRCTAKGAKTVVETSHVRVFTAPGARNSDTIARLFGCIHSSGKRVLLDESSDDEFAISEEFRKVRLNGRFVAWEHESYDISCKASCEPGYEPTRVAILARDLRATKSRAFAGTVKDESLVVGSRGTPAWLEQTPAGVEVHAGRELLDTGDIGALSLRGRLLRWTNAGVPRSATLR